MNTEYTFEHTVSSYGNKCLLMKGGKNGNRSTWFNVGDCLAVLANLDKLRIFVAEAQKPVELPAALQSLTPEQKETIAAMLAQKQAAKASGSRTSSAYRPARFQPTAA